MDELYNKHYLTVDDRGRILDGWSDGPFPLRDTTGTILLTDKGSYQFRLWPGGEENPALTDEYGIPLYAWDGAAVIPRTEEEIEADRAALPAPEIPVSDTSVWDELDAAYQEGVNGAYDQ